MKIINFVLLLGLMTPFAQLSAMLPIDCPFLKPKKLPITYSGPKLFTEWEPKKLSLVDALKSDSPSILVGPGITGEKCIKYAVSSQEDRLRQAALKKLGIIDPQDDVYKQIAQILNQIDETIAVPNSISCVDNCYIQYDMLQLIQLCMHQMQFFNRLQIEKSDPYDKADNIAQCYYHQHGFLDRLCGLKGYSGRLKLYPSIRNYMSTPLGKFFIKHEIAHLQNPAHSFLPVVKSKKIFRKMQQAEEKRADICAGLNEPDLIPDVVDFFKKVVIAENSLFKDIKRRNPDKSIYIKDVQRIAECIPKSDFSSSHVDFFYKILYVIGNEYAPGNKVHSTFARPKVTDHPSRLERIVYMNELRKVLDRDKTPVLPATSNLVKMPKQHEKFSFLPARQLDPPLEKCA